MKNDMDNVIKRATIQSLDDVLAPYIAEEFGFTGTRAGSRVAQQSRMRTILVRGRPSVIRHGGAHGADTEFHAVWREAMPRGFADVWPANDARAQIFMEQPNVHVHPVIAPLDRNEEIVKRSKLLIAASQTPQEVMKSGTWMTIRCARRENIPIIILWPSGVMTLDWNHFLSRITL